MSSESRWIWHFGHPPPGPMTETEDVLGGKGAALSRMTIAGLPVPPGFSISTEACRVYWASSRRLPDSLCNRLQEAVAQIESKTGSRYGVGPQPLLLAVRSGAKQSMPGMMATLLNCGMTRSLVESHDQSHALADAFAKFIADFARVKLGLDVAETEPSQRSNWQRYLQRYEQMVGEAFPDEPWRQLELAVGMVFDSWNSQRAVQYRALRGIRDLAGTAVNVQAMVPAQRSGLLFSQDPLKRKRNTWVVEVVSGLGDQLAAGQQTPQRFFVSRDARAEADRVAMDCGQPASLAIPARREPRPPESAAAIDPLLSVDQLVELSELGRVLEREFGCSVDVEWGLHDDRFVLFQSRPQDTNEVASRQDACIDRELARLRNAANEGGVWVRHNLAESVPAPTPLTWDILQRYMSGSGGFGRLYRDLGYAPSRRICRTGFLDLVFGQIYADPSQMAEMFCTGLPMSYDLERLRQDVSLLDRAPDKLDANATDARFLLRLPHILWVLLRAGRRTRRVMHSAQRHFEQQIVPEFDAWVEREQGVDLGYLNTSELLKCLDGRLAVILDQFAPEFLKPGLFGGLAFVRVEGKLVRILGEPRGQRMARALVQGLEVDWRCGPDAWLQQGAEFSLPEFLERYGHRAMGEMELANPRWHEESASLEQLRRQYSSRASDTSDHLLERAHDRRARAESRLPKILAAHGASSLVGAIRDDLAAARQLLPYREIGKHYLMQGYDLLRQVIQALADRLNLAADIYFLKLDELQRCGAESPLADNVDRATLIEKRRFSWQVLQRLSIPDYVDTDALDQIPPHSPEEEDGGWIDATALSNGVARGPILTWEDAVPADAQRTGYVLVCKALDPGLTPLMSGACALVVERGGVLSHGAAVARQLGIPAVACANLRHRLEGASWLVVDGSRGRVMMERRA